MANCSIGGSRGLLSYWLDGLEVYSTLLLDGLEVYSPIGGSRGLLSYRLGGLEVYSSIGSSIGLLSCLLV